MDKVKAFFAQDIVKIIAVPLWGMVSGLVAYFVKDQTVRDILLTGWATLGVGLGIVSGGTSNLRSNASREQAALISTLKKEE